MESKKVFNITGIEELAAVAEYLLEMMKSTSRVALLTGDLGAGKTTLVKQIASLLGTTDDTSSPTYSLVNEYSTLDGLVYHIDLYRLQDTHEAVDMGIEEYLDSGDYCFIEWPQIIVPLVHTYWSIQIETLADEQRQITLAYRP